MLEAFETAYKVSNKKTVELMRLWDCVMTNLLFKCLSTFVKNNSLIQNDGHKLIEREMALTQLIKVSPCRY